MANGPLPGSPTNDSISPLPETNAEHSDELKPFEIPDKPSPGGRPVDKPDKGDPFVPPPSVALTWDNPSAPVDRAMGLSCAFDNVGKGRRYLFTWIPNGGEPQTRVWSFAEQASRPEDFPVHSWQNFDRADWVAKDARFHYVSEPFRLADPTQPVNGIVYPIAFENVAQFNTRGARHLIVYKWPQPPLSLKASGAYTFVKGQRSGDVAMIVPSVARIHDATHDIALYYKPDGAYPPPGPPWKQHKHDPSANLHLDIRVQPERPWPDDRKYWTLITATFAGLSGPPKTGAYHVLLVARYLWAA